MTDPTASAGAPAMPTEPWLPRSTEERLSIAEAQISTLQSQVNWLNQQVPSQGYHEEGG